jgi:F-type H+-transporting ATPase subunit epsilon
MNLQVITKNKTIYTAEVKAARFPGVDGLFGVLRNHAPMLFVLKKGTIKLKKEDNKEEYVEIDGGLMEVFKNEIVVMAD